MGYSGCVYARGCLVLVFLCLQVLAWLPVFASLREFVCLRMFACLRVYACFRVLPRLRAGLVFGLLDALVLEFFVLFRAMLAFTLLLPFNIAFVRTVLWFLVGNRRTPAALRIS